MSDGRIGNSNQYLQISGVVSAPAYSFASDNDTGIYRIGANNIGIAANGSKVLDISNTAVTITPATTLSAALTYGGVTLSNAVTGTGNMVLSASPTLTGTLTAAAANFSGIVSSATEFRLAQTYLRVATVADAGGWTFGGGYNFAFNSGVGWKHDSTGALSGVAYNNVGSIGFFAAGSAAAGTAAAQVATFASNLLTLSQPLNYGGVTLSNSVTGTGSMVLSASPTLTGTLTAATANFSGVVNVGATGGGTFSLNISTPSGTNAVCGTYVNGTRYGIFGSSQGSSSIITGDALGEFGIRAEGKAINFSTDSGTTISVRIGTSGNLGIGMTPTNILDITQTQNAASLGSIYNASNGASANAQWSAKNDSNQTTRMIMRGSANAGNFGMSAGAGELSTNSTVALGVGTTTATPLIFGTNNAERMRLDSSGNLGIGTTNPVRKLLISNGGAEGFEFGPGETAGYNYILNYNRNTSAYVINRQYAASYEFLIGGTEKMRLGSDGSFLVGTTTNGGWAGNAIGEFNTSVQGASFYNTANGSNNCAALFRTDFDASPLLRFYKGTAAAGQFISTGGATPNIQWLANNEAYVISGGSGGVKLTSGATAWASASDETLKTDLAAIQSGAEKVSSLRAVTGRYKSDAEGVSRSFLIAQDVKAVLPEAVSEDADGVLSLRYTEVIPLLVAAIKELNARLATVEGKVN